jgi:hypothetical protein
MLVMVVLGISAAALHDGRRSCMIVRGGGLVGTPFIDSSAWATANIQNCSGGIQVVFKYVQHTHPYGGASQLVMPYLTGDEPVEELALLADAVTAACAADLVAASHRRRAADTAPEELNETAIGNLALRVLHTGDNASADALATWRTHARGRDAGWKCIIIQLLRWCGCCWVN